MKTIHLFIRSVLLSLIVGAPSLHAQLLSNLQKLSAPESRLSVGDPYLTPTNGTDGPKSIVAADFDGDGKADLAVANKDGSITLYYGKGDSTFETPAHLHASTNELRGLVAADFHGAGRADLLVTVPQEGKVRIFRNLGARTWAAPTSLTTWDGARDLVAGDFDGDGRADLVVAGSTNGLRHFRGLGGGALLMMTDLSNGAATVLDLTQPAFYLRTFREPGHSRDELAVGRAKFGETNLFGLQVFGASVSGTLVFRGALTNLEFNALDIAPVLSPASNGIPDLVLSDNNIGSVVVYGGAPSLPARFYQTNEIFLCPGGGPRSVRLADFDGDGWNDVAVVQSSANQVLVFHNDHGALSEWQVLTTGNRPREMASADFNGDGFPDLAALNRSSQDISILNTGLGGSFTALDGLYPVQGEAVGLVVRDLNADGYDDVIQLFRSSGLLSVRLVETNGVLGAAALYSMGDLPSALVLQDVNRDGVPDALAACLGASVVVRLGAADGTFGPAITNSMPEQSWGSLSALFPADLDGDGYLDIAAHYYDCRLALFRGNGTGHFSFTSVQSFAYESHALAAADFDGDGDLDVLAFGYNEEVVVLENLGDMLTSTSFHKVVTHVSGFYGAEAARTGDFNHDGIPDVLASGYNGARIAYGNGDLTFDASSNGVLSQASAASFALADADGDGIDDLVLGCAGNACVLVLKGASDGTFTESFRATVPSSTLVASGDLDGDGRADLVGTGNVLWTALSSRPPAEVTAPPPVTDSNAVPARVFINEILAANTALPLAADGGQRSDWVEIFSNIRGNTNISGWSLRLEKTNFVSSVTNGVTNVVASVSSNSFTFPPATVLSNGAHLVLVCSTNISSLRHTGFKLPAEPAVLCLCDAAGNVVDRVAYPAQSDNIAYGRYRDGLPGFATSSNPSPGLPNVDDGPIGPRISLDGVDGGTVAAGTPIRFFARASDDVGVRNVSLIWRRLDIADTQDHRVILYDDGMSGDLGFGDGLYAGRLAPGLPSGASIQFYLECTDLSGQVTTAPGEPVFVAPGQRPTLSTLAIGGPGIALEISEVVADNRGGYRDEGGGTPDWIEVRNTSTGTVSLAGLQLALKFFGNGSRYDFPTNRSLVAGEHLVLFADAKPIQGPLHAPFNLNSDGDELWLTGAAGTGARSLIDTVKFGAQGRDKAWARLGVGGPWHSAEPTPAMPNLANTWAGLPQTNGTFTFGYSTQPGYRFTVEYAYSIDAAVWVVLEPVVGTGVEQSVTQPMGAKRFYRVRRDN